MWEFERKDEKNIRMRRNKIITFVNLMYQRFTRTLKITRITTVIKAWLKKSDDQKNIDKYRVAEYHRISYCIKINLPNS